MKTLALFLSVITSLLLTTTLTLAQAIEVPLTVTMDGVPRTLYFGFAPGMTRCLNAADVVNGHPEGELPPFPPSGVPEIRFVYFSTGADNGCFGQGTANDYRPFLNAAQRDTFKLKEQAGQTFAGTITWPNMSAYFGYAMMKFTGTTGAVTIDMMTTNSLDMSDLMANADPSTITIYTGGGGESWGHFSPDPIPALAFGSVSAGNTVHQNFTVSNTGAGALHITGLASSNPVFSITPATATIAVGGNQVFDVAFAPTALGAQTGNITFTHDGNNGPTTVLAVSGIGASGGFNNPDPIAFGNVFILASATQNLTVTNGSGSTFIVTGITLSSQFTLAGSPSFPVAIPGGGNAVFQIVFTPTAVGPVSGATAVVAYSAGPSLTIGLTGTGVKAFSVAPLGPLSFGNVVVGDVSAAQNLTVTNASAGAMNVSAAAAAAGFAVSPAGPVSIPGGGNQVFAVTFAPTALGTDSGSVAFTHNGGNSPDYVAVNGMGADQFSIFPTFLAFGAVPYGGPPVTLPVTVTNNAASASLVITGVTLGDAAYEVAPTLATIPAGGNQVFNVTFTPPVAPDFWNHNTTLTFSFAGGPRSIPVTGSSIIVEPPHYVTITGDSITKWFGYYYERPALPWSVRRPTVPNWVNLLQQIVVRGGFAPNTPESDAKGGMVVGTSFMVPRGSTFVPARILRDTAWVRLTSWYAPRSIGYSYQQIQGTLRNNIRGTVYHHDKYTRGLDSTKNPGDTRRVALRGEQIGIFPRVSKNQLFAEQVALKLNIVACAMGYTNECSSCTQFDQLVLNMPGNTFNGMSIGAIAEAIDDDLTFWQGHVTRLADAYSALYAINRAFPTSLSNYDVYSWQAGTFRIWGAVRITSVPFLTVPLGPSAPIRIEESNGLFESGVADESLGYDPNSDASGPTAMKLNPNFPNPFNPSTTISFTLFKDANLTLTVYNVLGQEVATLLQNEEMNAGPQTLSFDASDLSSGVYYYSITGQDLETGASLSTSMGKMLLIK
jgi:hypothetical protein